MFLRKTIESLYKGALPGDKKPLKYQLDTLIELDRLRNKGEKKAYVVYAKDGGLTTVAAIDITIFSRKYISKSNKLPKILWLSDEMGKLIDAREAFTNKLDLISENNSYNDYGQDSIDEELIEVRTEDVEQTVLEELDQTRLDIPIINSIEEWRTSSGGLFITSIQMMNNLVKKGEVSSADLKFDYIVIDKCEGVYSPRYKRVLPMLSYDFMLGLTAMPFRSSDQLNVGNYFKNLACEKNIVELVDENILGTIFFSKTCDES